MHNRRKIVISFWYLRFVMYLIETLLVSQSKKSDLVWWICSMFKHCRVQFSQRLKNPLPQLVLALASDIAADAAARLSVSIQLGMSNPQSVMSAYRAAVAVDLVKPSMDLRSLLTCAVFLDDTSLGI